MLRVEVEIVVQFAAFRGETGFGFGERSDVSECLVCFRDLGQVLIQLAGGGAFFVKCEHWFALRILADPSGLGHEDGVVAGYRIVFQRFGEEKDACSNACVRFESVLVQRDHRIHLASRQHPPAVVDVGAVVQDSFRKDDADATARLEPIDAAFEEQELRRLTDQ